jgi:general secretion pathway protein M
MSAHFGKFMQQYLRSQIVIPLVTVACLLAVCLAAGAYVYQKHQWVQTRLADFIGPRYARLAGLKAGGDALSAAALRARELEALYVHDGSQDANQTGNEVQQRVRSLLTAAGMSISSSQVLPAKTEAEMERIPLSVRAEGDITSLQGALIGLAEQRPAVIIDQINIQSQDTPDRGVQRLSVQFGFLILRRLQS